MLHVLVRIDAAGERPVVVDDERRVKAFEDDARWLYVCEVETPEEGQSVCAAWLAARDRGCGQ